MFKTAPHSKYFFKHSLKKIPTNFIKLSIGTSVLLLTVLLLQQTIFKDSAKAQDATQTINTAGTVVINAGTVIVNTDTVVKAASASGPTPTSTVSSSVTISPSPTSTLTPTPQPTNSSGKNYYIDPSGNDSNSGLLSSSPFKSIQKAIDLAQGGDTITLGSGNYNQDLTSKRNGSKDKPIVITGPKEAVIKGAGKARVFEINHSYITLTGFTIDGLAGSSSSISGYRDKLIYVQGKGTKTGVTGLKITNMAIRNAGGECIRLRYFAQNNEIASNTITNCGVHDFKFSGGGKNGEGIYIGTAPEQLGDGKNPTSDPDQSSNNSIHHNDINTQGNECVDIKEAATGNIVEYNKCTGQKDSNSAGLDSRGEGNTFRFNEIYGNSGAGVRLGGDKESNGINNNINQNIIKDNKAGGIKFQRTPQGKICGNTMSGNTGGNSVGTFGSTFNPTQACN